MVISLDFEIHWGVRDIYPADGAYRANLLGVRDAVPAILALFREFGVAATWATVGFLFATSRDELRELSPAVRPAYRNPALSPYDEPLGLGEADDPLHFAPGLIEAVRATPLQEIATHTFSHYYCLEPGQSRQAFAADLESAVAIARRRGVRLRSIVFPRNQHNPAYEEVLANAGIRCFRGNPRSAIHGSDGMMVRGARLVDAYSGVAGSRATRWTEVPQENGLFNVPASLFLRPYSPRLRLLEPVRLRAIVGRLQKAARAGEIFHLWWHPHNFGLYVDENLAMLRKVLEEFDRCRRSLGMRSMSMDDVVETLAHGR
jgi:peptidoglycan/xylan/chitin deacetylase (PgdA/CDA1 family)